MRFGFIGMTAALSISNIRLLGYTGMSGDSGIGLVGVDNANELCFLYDYDIISSVFKSHKKLELGKDEIVNIIPLGATKDELNYVVTTRAAPGKFKNRLCSKNTVKMDLMDSTTIPMLVTDMKDLSQLLAYGKDGSVMFYRISNGSMGNAKEYELNERLSETHTSAFIDLTGNLRANLALNTVSGSENNLSIFNFHTGATGLVQRIKLPKNIGPTLFYDSNDNQSFDLIYVSVEGNASYLNLHYNKSVPKKVSEIAEHKGDLVSEYFDKINPSSIYNETPDVRINLSAMFGGVAVIQNENVPTGLFLADIYAHGQSVIFVTMLIDGVKRVRALQITNQSGQENSELNKQLEPYENVLGISVADINDRGKEDIFINYIRNGEAVLTLIKVSSPVQNYKLSALGFRGPKDAQTYTPGTTYMVIYNNKSKMRKGAQMPSTSYPSLQHGIVFIGLGPTNFFISNVLARTNCSKGAYDHHNVKNIIVPNSSIIFNAEENMWTVKSIFLLTRYRVVTIFLISSLVVNVFFLLFLTMREKSSANKSKSIALEENMLRPIFTAL